MKTIIFSPPAVKEFDALPIADRDRVMDGLSDYAIAGRGDVKRLANRAEYRLRIGRFRVIFAEDQTTILAIYIGKRDTTTYRRR